MLVSTERTRVNDLYLQTQGIFLYTAVTKKCARKKQVHKTSLNQENTDVASTDKEECQQSTLCRHNGGD
jgi:hypothetical protein